MATESGAEGLSDLLRKQRIYASAEITAARVLLDAEWGVRVDAPKALMLECMDARCGATMTWDLAAEVSLSAPPKVYHFFTAFYRCRHCRSSWIRYELAAERISDTSMRVTVHGIYPRQFPGTSSGVIGALAEEDAVLYLHAVECRSGGMGLGALAYLRRVVENSINLMLDLLAEVLRESEDPKRQEYVAQVEWLKSQKAFDKKAIAAAAVLPKSFFAGGHNPFSRLHEWSSAGVHNESDEECVELFDEIHGLFEALFERLENEKETRRLYADRLGKLSKAVPAKALQNRE